jgi:hypothetical protein
LLAAFEDEEEELHKSIKKDHEEVECVLLFVLTRSLFHDLGRYKDTKDEKYKGPYQASGGHFENYLETREDEGLRELQAQTKPKLAEVLPPLIQTRLRDIRNKQRG